MRSLAHANAAGLVAAVRRWHHFHQWSGGGIIDTNFPGAVPAAEWSPGGPGGGRAVVGGQARRLQWRRL
jgi:hypothetical protein